MRIVASAVIASVVLLQSPFARGAERQLSLAGHLGGGLSSGPVGGAGASGDLEVGYGLNDAFALYAATGYGIAFPSAPQSPRHAGLLAAGVTYAFDYVRVVPYLGVGMRVDVIAAPGTQWWTPSAEARGGAYYLINRHVALDLQVSFAAPFLRPSQSADFFTACLGVQFLRDL